ncbi:hypothetical protein L7F22_052023 [Adiantum nelumboides]|nr:hypothetical protein [Adiantum nelumboides]
MLHQLDFKLQIEQQYKMGIDKMAKLYQAEGDRKSKNDAESKRVESASKIRLLQQSLKRYKQLHVMDESAAEEEMPFERHGSNQRVRTSARTQAGAGALPANGFPPAGRPSGGLSGIEQQTSQLSLRPQEQLGGPASAYGQPAPGRMSPSPYGRVPPPKVPEQQQQQQQPQQRPYEYNDPNMASKPPRPLPQQPPSMSQGRPQMTSSPSSQSIGGTPLPGSSWRQQAIPPSGSQQSLPVQQVVPSAVAPPPTQQPIQAPTPQQAIQQQPPASQQQQQVAPRNPPSSKRKIGLNDFNFLAVLGKGNFGKVMLAEEKKSGYLYAIKVLKKEFIIENDEVESTKSEKRVFLAAARERHPFLLGLHSCFQTETRVYFVMEYVSGGDLMLHIQREQFTPRRAKFYAAEVLLALEYFHKQGIIYRDLKLDNILLTLDGHVKVADYGLCKEDMWFGNTTSTFCGTPEFMAPEILLEQRYGRAVDWWAFGILIYEMLLGQAPFRGDDEDEIFDAILEDEPLYPIHMPPDSVSILHKLLTRDPARRLGSGQTDAEEIKAHPFFRDVNWDDMFHKRVPPPFLPTLKNQATRAGSTPSSPVKSQL